VKLWDTAGGECRQTLDGHAICASALAFHPRAATLASGGWDGRVILGDTTTGKQLAQSAPKPELLHALAWVGGGEHLLAIYGDGESRRAVILEAETLQSRREGEPILARQMAISPDGTRLATVEILREVGRPKRVEIAITDSLSGEERGRLSASWDRVHALAISPDGTRLALSGRGEDGHGMSMLALASGERLWRRIHEQGEAEL